MTRAFLVVAALALSCGAARAQTFEDEGYHPLPDPEPPPPRIPSPADREAARHLIDEGRALATRGDALSP